MLHAKNLSYEYASNTSLAHVALRDVSLSLEEGGSLLIVGSTGSGKSTLLRVLAGLLDPATGSVLVNDKPVRPASVGLVFQQPESQLFSETVISDVAFGPPTSARPRRRPHDWRVRPSLRLASIRMNTVSVRPSHSLVGRRVVLPLPAFLPWTFPMFYSTSPQLVLTGWEGVSSVTSLASCKVRARASSWFPMMWMSFGHSG